MKDTGKVVTNTKDIADFFGKEHSKVAATAKKLAETLEDGWASIIAAELDVKLGGGALRTIKGYNLTYLGAKALAESFTGAKSKELAVKFLRRVAEPPDITPIMQLIDPVNYPTPKPALPTVIESTCIRVEESPNAALTATLILKDERIDELNAQVEALESRIRGYEVAFQSNGNLGNMRQILKSLVKCVLDARKSEGVLSTFRAKVDVFLHELEDYRDKKRPVWPVLPTSPVDTWLNAQASRQDPDNDVEILIKTYA